MVEPVSEVFETPSGCVVRRVAQPVRSQEVISEIAGSLDDKRGVLLTSDFEYPERYSRFCRGFYSPPLTIVARGRELSIEALNERGLVLLQVVVALLKNHPHLVHQSQTEREARFSVPKGEASFLEEDRMRQPSVVSAVRALMAGFSCPDGVLGLYGAFGYDLVFQFDSITKRHQRDPEQPDMVLYLPDDIVVLDSQHVTGQRYTYEFSYGDLTTDGGRREPFAEANRVVKKPSPPKDKFPFAARVEDAKAAFKRGDLFEVVLTMTFHRTTSERPSDIFSRLRQINPAPYGALLNLGGGEHLVSGSPEMFVRVSGNRVETCPISGTAARGRDALEDAERALALLNSIKDESELTMCTDVDRNDKARVCVPGSVTVIGRRQIETYSRVIHTVDHIEGQLRPECDGIDAFLTHMWAVTVTGAPKLWAMRFIEDHEADARLWYGGAFGYLSFDGNVNTGLTLRTVRLKDGEAQVRAGSTLLHDSVPADEEAEARLKAAAFLDALEQDVLSSSATEMDSSRQTLSGARILLLDCEDSFVLTLGDYVRQVGADVRILRVPKTVEALSEQIDIHKPDLLLISPGPGRPEDFGLNPFIAHALKRELPIFGVCLGLQAIVEYFGGPLELLDEPMHGKTSTIKNVGGRFFESEPKEFRAGRYHSIFVDGHQLPESLIATGGTDDGVVMQIEHKTLPIAAVQFHPESIMTSSGGQGLILLRYALSKLLDRESA